jgi:hypothetical protein
MSSIMKVKNGICYDLNGWKYMSIRGSPRERGYAHGYFVAKEFKEIQKMLNFVIYEDFGETWDFFIEASKKLYNDKLKQEYHEFYLEMEGIAAGINAGGTKTSLDEIIAWNNYFALTENWYSNRDASGSGSRPHHGEGGSASDGSSVRRKKGQQERCSAFMVTGKDFTEDGKIVCAHNNFSNFVDGQYANCVIDIRCEKGNRILYQAFAGFIWSGTDFFVTSKGIIGTETTMGGFLPFENNLPISCRIRQAMQYGNTLDDYVEILLKGNSGDYANSWMFGDINTNEIMLLELGLKYHNVKRTKNGYFIGFNAPYDPRIRNLESADTGFDDIRRHQGARRVRLDDLMQEHKGKINIYIAKEIISDHYDVYLNKTNPCSRTCCSHYDLDAREYMSDPSRPKPYAPRGALDGCVIDATMAKNMSFELRYGNSCGTPFLKNDFCDQNRQWAYLRPYLHNRPQMPWTIFSTTNKYSKRGKQTKRKTYSGKKSRRRM